MKLLRVKILEECLTFMKKRKIVCGNLRSVAWNVRSVIRNGRSVIWNVRSVIWNGEFDK